MSNAKVHDWMTRTGATPGKLALVAVLAVVLAYVVLSRLPGSAPHPAAGAAAVAAGGNVPAEDKPPPPNPWPEVELAEVVAHDPFAPPAWAAPPRVVETKPTSAASAAAAPPDATPPAAASLANLVDTGAAVVVILDGEPLALVGDQHLRVGDRINGYRVTAINESGVVLAEGDAP